MSLWDEARGFEQLFKFVCARETEFDVYCNGKEVTSAAETWYIEGGSMNVEKFGRNKLQDDGQMRP